MFCKWLYQDNSCTYSHYIVLALSRVSISLPDARNHAAQELPGNLYQRPKGSAPESVHFFLVSVLFCSWVSVKQSTHTETLTPSTASSNRMREVNRCLRLSNPESSPGSNVDNAASGSQAVNHGSGGREILNQAKTNAV